MSRRRRRQVALLAPLLVLTLSAPLLPAAQASDTTDTTRTPGPVASLSELTVVNEQVAFGLQRPIALTGLPDGRLLIAEKRGTVRVYHPDTGLAADPILDLTDRIDPSDNERGLLGLTPAPDFARTGMLYVSYTALPDGRLTLSRMPITAPDREQILLTQDHSQYGNHNGGQVAFGIDRYLYWSLGDGGYANDPFDTGQDLTTLLGKIVRIDVGGPCGSKPYCIPHDNPFANTPGALPEIWVYGVRNAWRFSIDPADNSLWIGDVGQGWLEEVNHVRQWQSGANLGWSCREGTTVFDEAQCRDGQRYVDPVFEYDHLDGNCSITGGVVYRGSETPEARGVYLASDYCSTTAFAVRPKHNGYESAVVGTLPIQPTAIAPDANGELYVLSDLPGWLSRVRFERVEQDSSVGAANR